MTRGKIVLTPFPFTDLTANKVRPAVVVSDSARTGVDLILAFISSVYNSSDLSPTDELMEMTDVDFALTGLKKNSVFKMDKLRPLIARLFSAKSAKYLRCCKPNSTRN